VLESGGKKARLGTDDGFVKMVFVISADYGAVRIFSLRKQSNSFIIAVLLYEILCGGLPLHERLEAFVGHFCVYDGSSADTEIQFDRCLMNLLPMRQKKSEKGSKKENKRQNESEVNGSSSTCLTA
jgi:hypothetical protein